MTEQERMQDAARRADAYLGSVETRDVFPGAAALAGLTKFDEALPERGRRADDTLERLDRFGFGETRLLNAPTDAWDRVIADPLPALDDLTKVNTGEFDPFEMLIARAGAAGAWVHVDGAFGLWARAAPALRPIPRLPPTARETSASNSPAGRVASRSGRRGGLWGGKGSQAAVAASGKAWFGPTVY